MRLIIRDGLAMRVNLSESVAFPLFKYGCYPHQLPEDRIAMTILRRGDVVWDVGANIGYKTVVFSEAVGESGAVFSIEPGPRTFRQLQNATRERSNVTLIQSAISNRVGRCAFDESPQSDLSHVTDSTTTESAVHVAMTTLDLLLEEHRPPAYLKIDVEGHELAVFNGAEKLLRAHAPVIEFEALTDELFAACRDSISRLSDGGYRYFRVRKDSTLLSAECGNRDGLCNNNFFAVHTRDMSRLSRIKGI